MSKLTSRLKHEKVKRSDLPDRDAPSKEEQGALKKLQAEAKAAGATLATGGKGGLPSSMVLGRMRRDDYECKVCGGKENLSMHHKAGIVESEWLNKKGHKLQFNNLVTICEDCHDQLHEEARAKGVDSSQVTPEGDKGTKRDRGLPDAEVDE